MSQFFVKDNSSSAPDIETLTGNSGGAVGPDGAFNINTVGTGSITIVGNPGTNTLTTQLTGLTNHSLLVGAGTATITNLGVATNGQLPIGSTGADPVLATLTAGTGISITNGAGSITINGVGGGLTWQRITGSGSLAVNNGYIAVSPGVALSLSLPATSNTGDIIELVLNGATSWSITQGAGQQVRVGNVTTTLGAGGSITSTAQGDGIRLVCDTANTIWVATPSPVGSLTIV